TRVQANIPGRRKVSQYMSTATTIPQIPVETVPPPLLPATSKETSPYSNMPPLRKAAVLMITIGDELAGTIYQHLSEHEVRLLTEEIAAVRDVPPDRHQRTRRVLST